MNDGSRRDIFTILQGRREGELNVLPNIQNYRIKLIFRLRQSSALPPKLLLEFLFSVEGYIWIIVKDTVHDFFKTSQ